MLIAQLIAVIITILIFLFIGWFYRNKDTSEEYFMAGRLAGKLKTISSIVTLFGAGEIVTLTAFAYTYSYYGTGIFIGAFISLWICSFFVKKLRAGHETYKPYLQTDYLRHTLGPKTERLTTLLTFIAVVSVLMIQFVVGGSLLHTVSGAPYPYAVIIVGAVICTYLLLGGFNSVLTTSVLQMTAVLSMLILLVVLYHPTGFTITESLTTLPQKAPIEDFVGMLILGALALWGSTDLFQLIYSAKDDNTAKKSLRTSGWIFLVMSILMITLGLKIHSVLPDANPNTAFIEFLATSLPSGISLLLMLFVLVSVFSVADTELFLSSMLLGKLIWGKNEISKRTGQALIFGLTITTIALAITFTSLIDIYFVMAYVFMISGPVLILRLLERGTDNLAAVSIALSTLILIILIVTGHLDGSYPLLLLAPAIICASKKAKSLANK